MNPQPNREAPSGLPIRHLGTMTPDDTRWRAGVPTFRFLLLNFYDLIPLQLVVQR